MGEFDGKSSRELIAMVEEIGWRLDRVKGDHHIFKHATRQGVVVIPHPKKDIPKGTVRQILKTAGLL